MGNSTLRWCGHALIGFGVLMVVWAIGLGVWPRSYVAKVRVKVEKRTPSSPAPYDPHWVQLALERIQSKVVLHEVIRNLNLDKRWSEQRNEPVDVAVAYTMLKRQMTVSQKNSTLLEIEVKSHDPSEAVAIANEVAKVFREQSRQAAVEIIDLATVPGRPVFPSVRIVIASWFLALTTIGLGILLRSNTTVSATEGGAASSELA